MCPVQMAKTLPIVLKKSVYVLEPLIAGTYAL
jgi:hypothetical protein